MAATDTTKFLNKTEYERSLGRISGEFDKVAYLGERISGTPVALKKLSVSPRQSIIVGRCIPLHPRKGKKYYFKDGLIKVKTGHYSEETPPRQYINYYILEEGSLQYVGNEPATETYHYSLGGSGFKWGIAGQSVLVEITEESPKGKASFDLATMAKITRVTIDNSITESPFIEIIDTKVVVTEIPRPKRVWPQSMHGCHYVDGWQEPPVVYGAVRGIEFKKGKVVAYSIGDRPAAKSRAGVSNPKTSKKRYWAINLFMASAPFKLWKKATIGAPSQIYKAGFRGEIRVFAFRRNRIGRTPYNAIAKHLQLYEVHNPTAQSRCIIPQK